jgi:hypothetical protein
LLEKNAAGLVAISLQTITTASVKRSEIVATRRLGVSAVPPLVGQIDMEMGFFAMEIVCFDGLG